MSELARSNPTTSGGQESPPEADRNVCPTTQAAVPAGGQRSFLAHAKLIGGLTLVSRVFGLLRETLTAHYFGAGMVSSAFTVAFTIPNLFRKLFGEGALSAAFIPLYSQSLKNEPREVSARFASASVNLLILILVGLTIIGEAIIWGAVLLRPEMRPDRVLTLQLTAIMLPYVVLVCGTAFLGAILQVHKRFGLPAAAPILLNVIHIGVILIGARLLHLHIEQNADRVIELQTTLSYWLAVFVLVAGAMQVMLLVPSLRAIGFRFTLGLDFWTPPVRKMLRLSVPVALGLGVLQLSVFLDKGLALMLAKGVDEAGQLITHFNFLGWSVPYPMEEGAAARLNWAQFLYQFPLGIFAIALATAIFPSLSADAMDAQRDKFLGVLRNGVEATMFEGLPASAGLAIVAVPAVRVLFEHGSFTAHDTILVARSVFFYSAAIWAFSLQQIINRAYYSLHDTKTPFVMSILTLGVNLAVELPLVWTRLGEAGMAAGTCVSFAVQAIVMLWLLSRRVGGLGLRLIAPAVIKMLIATAVMTAACIGVKYLPFYPHGATRRDALIQLVVLMTTGAGIYLGMCLVLGVGIVEHLRPRKKNSSPPPSPQSTGA